MHPAPRTAPDPVPGTQDEAITTYGRLVEVVRRLDRRFAASISGELGLPMAHFEVLLRLGRSPGDELTMSELARQLGITNGGATRLVDRVLSAGWVARRACTEDRRVQHVRLTPPGREVLERALVIHRADLARELTDRLDASQRATLDAILDELRTEDADTEGTPGRAPDMAETPMHGGSTGASPRGL